MWSLGPNRPSAFQPLGGFSGPLYTMTSQPAAGAGYLGYNSYPVGMGTFNLTNGYPVGYGYSGSGMESVNSFGFAFRKRIERIDWKRLASVDVDSVARNLDFQILQDNIINIAFCSLEAELDSRSIDPNYTKLFKLAQLMIEYLLHSQDYLWSKMQEVQQELFKEKSEHETTKKEVIEKLKAEIVDLKKELHQRKKVIAVQQQLLHNGNDAIHKCAFCGKAFVNASFLQAHLSRRHPECVGNQMATAMAFETSDFIKAPVLSTETPPVSHELENELLEIRERLRLTESQLVEERNARNATTQKAQLKSDGSGKPEDQKEKEQLEEEMNKRFESWKTAQLEMQKSEIGKVQNIFMKELKEMSSKLQAAEENLEEFKQKRSQGSMLGSLKDDVDPQEMRRQRREITEEMRKEMLNQVADVETRMRKEMLEHDKLWKKKMLQDKLKVRQMNEEMERLKEEENRRRFKAQEDKCRLKDEVMQRMSKTESSKGSSRDDHMKSQPDVEKAEVVVLPRAEVKTQVYRDAEEDDREDFESEDEEEDEDEEEKIDDYHRVREAQAAHLKETLGDEDDDEDDDDDDDFPLINIKERLQNDPDLIRACHSDNLQSLELALEALGIPKAATRLSNDNYLRNMDTLERERNRKHKKKNDQFSAIRRRYETEVNEKARQRQKQRSKSTPLKASDVPRTPRSNQSTLRSTPARPNSLPPQQARHTPKPSPRAGTLPAKMTSAGQLMMTTQSFTSTGTLSVTGTSARSDSNDEVDHYQMPAPQKRVVAMEPRPRAKTPPGASSAPAKTAASSSQLKRQAATEVKNKQESDEETSGWDDVSNVEPVPKARTKHQALNAKPGSVVAQRKMEIEKQLLTRDVKKPAGGYDVTPMKPIQSSQNTKKNTIDEPDDLDVLSLTSVSAADDPKPTPKPRHTNARSSVQSTSGPTISTNTSKWGSSISAGNSLSSFDAQEKLEFNDSWDDDDDVD